MSRKTIIVTVLLMAGFAATLILAMTGAAEDAELMLAGWINPTASKSFFFRFFTSIGEAAGVISVAAVFLIIPATTLKIGIPVASCSLISWLLNTGIKRIIRRARPIERIIAVGGFSFPSGHAMNNTALYISIMLAVLPFCRHTWQRILLITVCTVIPLLIGLSRIYFNVHYASDVAGGWCLGAAVAVISNFCYKAALKKRGTPQDD